MGSVQQPPEKTVSSSPADALSHSLGAALGRLGISLDTARTEQPVQHGDLLEVVTGEPCS